MLREKTKTEAEKTYVLSFVSTDEMKERLRVVLYNDRTTRGEVLRHAIDRYLTWREDNHSEVRSYLGLKGDMPFVYPKVSHFHSDAALRYVLNNVNLTPEQRTEIERLSMDTDRFAQVEDERARLDALNGRSELQLTTMEEGERLVAENDRLLAEIKRKKAALAELKKEELGGLL